MVKSPEENEELEASLTSDDDTVFNAENQRKEQKLTLKRIVLSMIVFSVVLGVLTSCLVIVGSQEQDFNQFSDLPQFTERLSSPAAQSGPEARNYVAYIPVPINDDDEEEEYEEDEYYDDDEYDEYYEEDEEYEEEEKKPSRKKKKGRHKGNRNSKPKKSRYHPSKSSTEDKERVPFLVPLMMLPENQVGVQKEFSFSKNSNERLQNEVDDDGGVFTSILNMKNNRRPPLRRNSAPNRLSRPRPNGIPSRPIHNIPGPPYRGPSPRNPNLPLDQTVIHPSIHRPRFRRPPRNFRTRAYTTSTSSTTEVSTTTEVTTAETVTKPKPNIIVVQQQPSYNPYRPPYSYNPYPPVYQPYPYPAPPPPTTTTATTTTTTTTIKTTTAKIKKKKKKRKKKPAELSLYKNKLSDDQLTSLSQPQLTIVDNKVVPIMNKQQQSILSKRFGLQARRFNQPFKVRGRRRLVGGVGGSQSSSHRGPYRDHRHQERPDRRFDMPNIFTQSGFPYDKYEEERPIISRPPPRHPGVRVPGVRVPANAGSIEDIISPKPVLAHNNRIPGTNNYRPPVKNVIHVQYDDPPGRPDHQYQKPAHRPHMSSGYDDRPQYQEPSYKPPPHSHDEPSYRPPPPSHDEHSYRPPPPSHDEPSYRPPRPSHDEPSYKPPPPHDEPSYHPNQHEPPYRPPPSINYDYRPTPSNDYDVPPRPQPSNEYSDPPVRPPTYYEDESPYRPGPTSYQEESYYEPPENEYGPIVQDYKPPKPIPPQYGPPPSSYKPRPEDVVPPAYNQDYYLTPDPQNDVYPGPDIYDGASVHGPAGGDRKSQFGYQPAPTLGPPTRRPPQVSSGYKPRPNDIDKYDSERYHPDGPDYSSEHYHPDGPDYSSGTLINSYKGSAPFKVGLDLYPIEGVSPLGSFGKQDIYSGVLPQRSGGDDNKHEILLHLNLFSKKPSILGGRSGSRAQDIDIEQPLMYRRQDAAMSKSEEKEAVHLELPSLAETIKGHPIFGNLNPFDILQHLLKQSLGKEDVSKKSPGKYQEIIKSRNFNTNNFANHKERENNESSIQNMTRRVDTISDYELSDQVDLDMEEAKSELEYYYYYYYDYMDSGIDISHELSTYEPLPTPLPVKQKEKTENLVTKKSLLDVTNKE